MSSLALITAEMHKLNSRAQECDTAKENLQQAKASSVRGYASLIVLGCMAEGPVEVDPEKISVSVAMTDNEDSLKNVKVKEEVKFDLRTMVEGFTITCHHEKMTSVLVDDSDGIAEQGSMVVIPYKAELSMEEVGVDGALTLSLEGKCDETTEVLQIRIKIVVDNIDDLIASKQKEMKEIETSIGELQKQLKVESNAQTESTKKETAKKASAPKSKGASGSVSAAVQPKMSFVQIVTQMGQMAIGVAYNSGSYLLFGGAATLIYFYGDYASI